MSVGAFDPRKCPKRRRAVQLIASMCPPISVKVRAGKMTISLEGEIGKRADGKGIFAAPIEDALFRHSSVSHIEVTINSNGGLVDEAMRIYKLLCTARERAHVTTVAGSMCVSAGTIILMAGELRLAETVNSKILLHQTEVVPTKSHRWTENTHRLAAKRLEETNNKILDIYAERCGNRKFFEREYYTEEPLRLCLAKAQNVIHAISDVDPVRWMNGRPFYS